MYGGDFGRVDLSQVVNVNGRATIATIASLDERLRSCEVRGLRKVILSSSVRLV